jgi:hypothetical protein
MKRTLEEAELEIKLLKERNRALERALYSVCTVSALKPGTPLVYSEVLPPQSKEWKDFHKKRKVEEQERLDYEAQELKEYNEFYQKEKEIEVINLC